jgi:hypothetical protein
MNKKIHRMQLSWVTMIVKHCIPVNHNFFFKKLVASGWACSRRVCELGCVLVGSNEVLTNISSSLVIQMRDVSL